MFGLTYMIDLRGRLSKAGLHVEPGIWATVPATTDPHEPPAGSRMASIPHGTVILAQAAKFAQQLQGGPQTIPNNNILPFFLGTPEPPNSAFDQVAQTFPELNLSIPTQCRMPLRR